MSSSDRDLVSARAIYVDMGYVQWRRFDGLVGRARHLIANGEAMGVIANEHYDEFAAKLQTEIEDECGVKFEGRIVNKKEVRTAKLKQGWRLNEDFKALWSRIKHKTRYAVDYQTSELVEHAARNLAAREKIAQSRMRVQKGGIGMSGEGVGAQLLSVREAEAGDYRTINVPDLLGYLQTKTELTRKTIAEILIRSGRLNEVQHNPQQFLEQGEIFGSDLNQVLVKNGIYDEVFVDSEIEREFAEAMSTRTDIKLFIKLPGWFMIDTPIGTYNPDWAIVKEDDARVYLVRETKSTKNQLKLRSSEWAKIQCGKAHFDTLQVDFAHITNAFEV